MEFTASAIPSPLGDLCIASCRHCERSEAIQARMGHDNHKYLLQTPILRDVGILDCFVACAPRNDGDLYARVSFGAVSQAKHLKFQSLLGQAIVLA